MNMVLFIEILIIFVLCIWFFACCGEPLFLFPAFITYLALFLLLFYRVNTGGWLVL